MAAARGATESVANSKNFRYTGGEQIFTVPAGVTSLDVTAVGGKGAVGSGYSPGGSGARATGKVAVTPGQMLFVEVGGNGGSPSLQIGGFNGGGNGAPGYGYGGGGGGATDIRTISSAGAGDSLGSRLLIAGGGGGGGSIGVTWAGPPSDPVTWPGGAGGAGGTPDGKGSDGVTGLPDPNNSAYGGGGAGFGGESALRGQGLDGLPAQDAYCGGGGAGGGGFFGGGGGYPGHGPSTLPPGGGSGGGGGGGTSHFGPTVTQTSLATDSGGVPLLRIDYKVASGNPSGLRFGKPRLKKKRGIAILPVTVPGSGRLSLAGKGLVKKRPAFARLSRTVARRVPKAGTYKLKVKAKGRKKAELLGAGKVKVKAVVTFKPTSGDRVSASKRIRLIKN